MTLIISAISRKTLWLLADRRLSYGPRVPPNDNGIKIVSLDSTDGIGLIGYAGLGATSSGQQPSEWISATLRGHSGSFVESLGILSKAAERELPRHLLRMPIGAHFILCPSFIKNVGARLYTIDNIADRATATRATRFTSHQRWDSALAPSVHLALTGSGGSYLHRRRDGTWKRDLRRLMKHNDRGKISDQTVADYLATLNAECSARLADRTVSPRSIVAWRRAPWANNHNLAGGQQYYNGTSRERDSPVLPSISAGVDLKALMGVMYGLIDEATAGASQADWLKAFASAFTDRDEVNRRISRLPDGPNEQLR